MAQYSSLKHLSHKISSISNDNCWSINNGTFYFGVDPTGPGLHIGHMLPISMALDLIDMGFKAIILVGGFTGSVGDPTGKLQTRKQLGADHIEDFSKGILNDLKQIFRDNVIFVNNNDWLSKMTIGDFMWFANKLSVNKKLHLDIFNTRLSNQSPLFMNEFLYPDLQAIDFWHLYNQYKCTIQIGGQDQWGNISYGVHAMNRLCNEQEFVGITTKLLENKGKKMGKSENNCVFVRDHINLYQSILQMDDEVTNNLCELFNISTGSDGPINKDKLGCFLIDLYYKNDKQKIQEAKDFASSIHNLNKPEKIHLQVPQDNILNIIKHIIANGDLNISVSDLKRLFKSNSIYMDKVPINDMMYVPPRKESLISVGKKKHIWVEIV